LDLTLPDFAVFADVVTPEKLAAMDRTQAIP
jgi:hypothetical protein